MALSLRKTALVSGARRSATSRTRVVSVSAFKVTLKTPTAEKTIECPPDTYILDAAEDAGLDLPYSCRAGTFSRGAGIVHAAGLQLASPATDS